MNDKSTAAFEAIQLDLEDARALAKTARDQQRATMEVLQVIRSSAGDSQKVFEKILDACQQLFKLTDCAITLVEPDGSVRFVALRGKSLEIAAHTASARSGSGFTARAIRAGRPLHVPDASAIVDPSEAVLAVMAVLFTLGAARLAGEADQQSEAIGRALRSPSTTTGA